MAGMFLCIWDWIATSFSKPFQKCNQRLVINTNAWLWACNFSVQISASAFYSWPRWWSHSMTWLWNMLGLRSWSSLSSFAVSFWDCSSQKKREISFQTHGPWQPARAQHPSGHKWRCISLVWHLGHLFIPRKKAANTLDRLAYLQKHKLVPSCYTSRCFVNH